MRYLVFFGGTFVTGLIFGEKALIPAAIVWLAIVWYGIGVYDTQRKKRHVNKIRRTFKGKKTSRRRRTA